MPGSELEAHCKKLHESYLAREHPSDPRLDAVIQAEVWMALWEAEDVMALDISQVEVLVKQCEVWLSGTVSDEHARQLAECLVKGIDGVNGCHNQLEMEK